MHKIRLKACLDGVMGVMAVCCTSDVNGRNVAGTKGAVGESIDYHNL